MAEAGTANALIEQLESDKATLENSVVHLQRSIGELKEAIATEGDDDREFKTAIEENIVVIARNKAKIERLETEIKELKQGIQNLDGHVAVPVTEPLPLPAPSTAGAKEEAMPDVNTSQDNSGMYL
jgi:chromosome segregation ATPase